MVEPTPSCGPGKSQQSHTSPLQWRHNDHYGVSNHQPHDCLLNHLFRRRSKKTSKLCITGLCVGNPPGPVNSPHKGLVMRKIIPFLWCHHTSICTDTVFANHVYFLSLRVLKDHFTFRTTFRAIFREVALGFFYLIGIKWDKINFI